MNPDPVEHRRGLRREPAGEYLVEQIMVEDRAENRARIHRETLEEDGLPTRFTIAP